jgi:NAD(P)H-hydrate epimerase
MLPVCTAEQMRRADALTIEREPITALDLMERAAGRCAAWIVDRQRMGDIRPSPNGRYVVVVGMGNNGGDGLVIARLLHQAGMPVVVRRVVHREKPSSEHATNLERARAMGVELLDLSAADQLSVSAGDVVIDALFGTGLDRPVEGLAAEVIRAINASGAPVIAIDLPSGLWATENVGNDPATIIRATCTLTFEWPKLALLLPDHSDRVGYWEVLSIGLSAAALQGSDLPFSVVELSDIEQMLRGRPRAGHKGLFGHALLIAGSRGRMGAAVLATRACLRSGAGLVTVHVPACGLDVLQSAAPEAMCSVDPAEGLVTDVPRNLVVYAVGIGPGLGTDPDTANVLKRLIQDPPAPLVLDADALNVLAENPTWTAFLPPGSILTPHPKEFDRLYGKPSASGSERLQRARDMALRTRCTVVLKGAPTAVCAPDGRVVFNSTGNAGMARGGSGDALTGLLTGLVAQGYAPGTAALVGVYLHGLAGDLVAKRKGQDGMSISDLIEALPEAWQVLRDWSEEPF